ncbi:MAG: glycine cleavage system H protein [Rubrivivax sp.]|nr:glycine cleavage system protein H [Rubrivivax sp.]
MSEAVNAPPDLHYLIEHQVWARLHEDGTASVGITALGIRLSGEIYMARPKGVGVAVVQGGTLAVVELAKSIVAVKSAVSGTVVGVNAELADRPQLVHQDPYGRGWLARVRLVDFERDRMQLVHGVAVAQAMAAHARLYADER